MTYAPISRKEAFSSLIPCHHEPIVTQALSRAPVNIALIKYWGKRNQELNLPITDSISVALEKYTTTTVSQANPSAFRDSVFYDGKEVSPETSFYTKIVEFISYIRPHRSFYFHIDTKNDVPTGSGLASSASGFCALAQALNLFFGWNLSPEKISCFARLGSGSACRSVFPGIVAWKKGEKYDGSDSYAISLPYTFPEMKIGIKLISDKEKPISSREAMLTTCLTSPLYAAWPQTVERHIKELQQIWQVPHIDFARMFALCEQNAISMHATMAASSPPIIYWTEETLRTMRKIFEFRKEVPSIPLFFTMDAGPNIKMLFLERDRAEVENQFPDIEIVDPFWS